VRAKGKDRAESGGIDGLNAADPGIRLLAGAVAGVDPTRLLLVCCGDLPGVGGDATRLVLDVRETSGSVAKPVLVGPGLTAALSGTFEHAVVWPRAHLGKDFTVQCLARAALSLREGGRLWCAVRKDKGADSVAQFMAALLGNVVTERREQRYRLLRSDASSAIDRDLARETLSLRYRIEDPLLQGLVVHACPGVFSRRELDAGTRVLIEHATTMDLAPNHVVDLCCGVGPLALWAARRWSVDVTAADSNAIAVTLCKENAESSGLGDRVRVSLQDGLPPPPNELAELAMVNPPTHADPAVLGRLLGGLGAWLRPGCPALAVVSRPGRAVEAFESARARVQTHTYARYTVVEARW
jgi:16S rRNA G1207 methylase RsmC